MKERDNKRVERGYKEWRVSEEREREKERERVVDW